MHFLELTYTQQCTISTPKVSYPGSGCAGKSPGEKFQTTPEEKSSEAAEGFNVSKSIQWQENVFEFQNRCNLIESEAAAAERQPLLF